MAMKAVLVVLSSAGVLAASADPMAAPFVVTSFSKYFNYAGSLVVSGTVEVGQEGTGTQVLFFDLAGVDPLCGMVNITGVANACGIHIHEGSSCTADAGKHYYSSSLGADPWLPVAYTMVAGKVMGENVRVATGKSLMDAMGRTLIVHDSAGVRVACSVLQHAAFVSGASLSVASFAKYPGYTGSLSVTGTMQVEQVGMGTGASQVLIYSLAGADPTCGTAAIAGVANACGVHVHVGKDCANASSIGGHYYGAGLLVDPWKPIQYTAPGGAASGTTVTVPIGVSSADVVGRTMVVHDSAGVRVACGIVKSGHADVSSAAPAAAVASAAALAVLLGARA